MASCWHVYTLGEYFLGARPCVAVKTVSKTDVVSSYLNLESTAAVFNPVEL